MGPADDDPENPAVAETLGATEEGHRGIGRYFVLDRVGGGGMGVVYAAYDPEVDRKLAIKLLRSGATSPELAIESRARVLREGQALARLQPSGPTVT